MAEIHCHAITGAVGDGPAIHGGTGRIEIHAVETAAADGAAVHGEDAAIDIDTDIAAADGAAVHDESAAINIYAVRIGIAGDGDGAAALERQRAAHPDDAFGIVFGIIGIHQRVRCVQRMPAEVQRHGYACGNVQPHVTVTR